MLIFGWHNVEGTPGFASEPGVGTAGITKQLEFLSRFATVVSLANAVDALEQRQSLPKRAVALTFDDGYRDNLEIAAPILLRLGLPATFFLAPELLEGSLSPWWEELAWALRFTKCRRLRWQELDLSLEVADRNATYSVLTGRMKVIDEVERRRSIRALVALLEPEDPAGEHRSPIMGWEEAKQLHAHGFTIGSHSMRHSILSRQDPASQAEDLATSRRMLRARLGCAADLLAYPNGEIDDFDGSTVQASRAAGYRAAVTTLAGWNRPSTPRMELRRFVMYPEWGVAGFGIVARHYVRMGRDRLRSVGPG